MQSEVFMINILFTISFVEMIIIIVGMLIQYMKFRHRFIVYYIPLAFIMAITYILFPLGIGHPYTSIPNILAELLQLSYGFFMIFLFDIVSRESTDPIKLGLVTMLTTSHAVSIIILTIGETYRWLNPEAAVQILNLVAFLNVVDTTIFGFIYLYYIMRIHRNAPRNIRKYSSISLAGALIIGLLVFVPVTNDLEITVTILIASTGYLITAAIWFLEPRLAYILPFRALRLIVIETQGGLPIYTHIWNSKDQVADNALFGGMLQGIGLILNEAVGKGNINEIILDDATLIINNFEQHSIAFVLITTQSSKSLRIALDYFAEKFITKFADDLDKTSEVQRFAPTSELIEECFPFIPEWEQPFEKI